MAGKIYLLRHEERGNSIDYETPLNKKGLLRAEKTVIDTIENLTNTNITNIYCSPFLRTIQTIAPYCRKYGLKIKLEWSIAESIPSRIYNFDEYSDIIDENYNSFLDVKNSFFNPYLSSNSFSKIKKRTDNFFKNLDISENILIVTHLPVINSILSNSGIDTIEMFTPHDYGSIVCIE